MASRWRRLRAWKRGRWVGEVVWVFGSVRMGWVRMKWVVKRVKKRASLRIRLASMSWKRDWVSLGAGLAEKGVVGGPVPEGVGGGKDEERLLREVLVDF